ncbi:MAG: TolC family protein [Acidobacteriota bacterium]|nr:TolC family protein [Acidobacteriota bacterium]
MRQDLLRAARLISGTVALLGLAVSVSAQTGQPMPAPPAAATDAASNQPGPVRRLSIEDAVQLALEHNLDIQVQRLNPQIQDLNVVRARTNWTPKLQSTLNGYGRRDPVASILSGGASSVNSGQFATSLGVNQLLPWGGSYSADWQNQRQTTDSLFQNVNPVLQSTLNLNYTQPLLRNFRIDSTRDQILVSAKNREISEVQLRQTVVQTVRAVKDAYWDLSYAINSLKVQQESLNLAQESLRDNQKRVQIGTMAPIDIVEAQAEVASREEAVVVAQGAIKQAEDQLRTLILDPSTPDFWSIDLEPTDAPTLQTQPIDVEAAVRNALAKRTDLQVAQKSIEANDVNIRYYHNQLLPDVSAQVNYGVVGLGGTQFIRDNNGFPGNIIGQVSQGFGSVLGDLFQNNFPNWSVGVTVGYPIGRSTAQASLAQARLYDEQAKVQLRNMELQVAAQVRQAARTVNTDLQRVNSSRAARELQEQKLAAEQKKFTAGMSTNFQVFQAQRDLSSARNDEIQAILDYNKALVDFQTVQESALSSNGGNIVLGGTTSTTGTAGSTGTIGTTSPTGSVQQ